MATQNVTDSNPRLEFIAAELSREIDLVTAERHQSASANVVAGGCSDARPRSILRFFAEQLADQIDLLERARI